MAKTPGYQSKAFAWEMHSEIKEAKAYARDQLEDAIRKAVDAGEEEAHKRLRRHPGTDPEHIDAEIFSESGGLDGKVVSPVWYSRFVEYGTVRTAAIPFMRPANRRMRRVFRQEVGEDLFKGLKSSKVRTRATSRSGLSKAYKAGRIGKRDYFEKMKTASR